MQKYSEGTSVIVYANLIANEIQRPEIRNAPNGLAMLAACSPALDDFRYDILGTLYLIKEQARLLNRRNHLPANDEFAFKQIADGIVIRAQKMAAHPNPDERFPYSETLEDIARGKANASVFCMMFKDHIVRSALAA